MMKITDPRITEYIEKVTPEPDPVLREMAIRARDRGFPYIGPQVGRLLYMLVRISGARRIFEFGSGFGYSLYWMAQAASPDARLIGCEYDAENVQAAAEYFQRGGIGERAQVWHGEAVEIFNSLDGEFDIIVNDAEKTQYSEIFRLAAPRLKVGGLFISDNVLWDGEVIQESSDPETKAIREFNHLVFADERFCCVILPVRDGLLLATRIR